MPSSCSREPVAARDPGHRTAALMRRLFATWRADTRGVAAVEFALVAPLMAAMFVGAVEMSQAITVDRRVTQIAGSTADLVARASKTISQSEIGDIMRVGSYIMKPYTATPIRIVLRNVTFVHYGSDRCVQFVLSGTLTGQADL